MLLILHVLEEKLGSYGKDTRGLLRLHQFNKVEMVQFVHPDNSYSILEQLLCDAESILKALGLHYRIVSLCKEFIILSFKNIAYDIEIWAPGEKKFLEVQVAVTLNLFSDAGI